MERIAYKIALDVTKAESQKFLTGFSIGETRARVLKITLNNGRNPVHFDGSETISMFVTKPSDTSPSIGLCYLEGDTIVYNVLQSDVSEEGPTKFSIKVEQTEEGLITVLYAAHFTIQVTDPECDDSHVPDDPNYSILEALIAEVEQFDSDAEAFAIGSRGGVPVDEDDPAYHNNAKYYAENLEYEVEEQVERAEAWASGTKGGVPVGNTEPQYHNNAKYYAEQADTSATNAGTSETNAAVSELAASGSASSASADALKAEGFAVGEQGGVPVDNTSPYYHNNAKYYKEEAATSATNAGNSETAASGSASSAAADALKAEGFAVGKQNGTDVGNTSPYYHNNAEYFKEQASQSATNAGTSETNAAASELAASGSATTASNQALVAEGWAKGKQNGVDVGPDSPYYHNNAEYFKNEAHGIVGDKVDSFNNRTGPVIPLKGDYNSAKIEIDPSTTSLPNTLDTLQDYLEYMYPPGVSVTLTLNGAKNDVITIKDSNDETVGTCTFTSGQTSGTVSVTVPNGGGSYKFISSVSKSLSDGTSDYEKTVTLSDAATQTVNVYPKIALDWFGDFVDSTTFECDSQGNITRNVTSGNITINTNSIVATSTGDYVGLMSNQKIPTGVTVKALVSFTASYADGCASLKTTPSDSSWSTQSTIHETTAGQSFSDTIISGVNSADGFLGVNAYHGTLTIKSVWLDDGHESDITIHGAKEDTITITDSNNQTVATCVFGSGSTVGYVSKSLLPSGTYTFTSSVSGYAKTVTLDGSETEVSVMPDVVAYWEGNKVGNSYTNKNVYPSGATRSVTDNTNSIAVTASYGAGASISDYFSKKINTSGKTLLKIEFGVQKGGNKNDVFVVFGLADDSWTGQGADPNVKNSPVIGYGTTDDISLEVRTLDISSVTSGDYYVALKLSISSGASVLTIKRAWLE